MSSANNRRHSTTSHLKFNKSKPFCNVCHAAGKAESVYTSHFVKNKPGNDGVVVCPYLLSLTCTYCKKKEGHTAQHCPVLKHKTDKIIGTASKAAGQASSNSASNAASKASSNASSNAAVPPPQVKYKSAVGVALNNKYSPLSAILEQEEDDDKKKMESIVQRDRDYPAALGIASRLSYANFSWGKKEQVQEPAKQEPAKQAVVAEPISVYRSTYFSTSWADEE